MSNGENNTPELTTDSGKSYFSKMPSPLKLSLLIFTILRLIIPTHSHAGYDIYQQKIDGLILVSRDFFTSAALFYPGLLPRRNSQKGDTTGYKHLIIGTKEIETSELSPVGLFGHKTAYSPVAGLYGTLMNEFKPFNAGIYLGSLQFLSTAGESPLKRYGFRTALFMENKTVGFGGAKAELHLDRLSQTVCSVWETSLYNSDTTMSVENEAIKQFNLNTADLSILLTLFPSRINGTGEQKMISVDFFGSNQTSLTSDTSADLYLNVTGDDSLRQYRILRVPQIRIHRFDTDLGRASASFVLFRPDNLFLKLSASVLYSRQFADTTTDTAQVDYSNNNGYLSYQTKRKKSISDTRYDTAGFVMGFTERFVLTKKPLTFIAGVEGEISLKLFKRVNEVSLHWDTRAMFNNSSLREYHLSVPVMLIWERKSFSLDIAWFPAMNFVHTINSKINEAQLDIGLQTVAMGFTYIFGNVKGAFIPSLKGSALHLNQAEIHYRTVRK